MNNKENPADSACMPAITPHLVCAGAAEATDFYTKAFGATEMIRLPASNGKLMHACVNINGSAVMLADESPEHGMLGPKSLNGTPVTIHLNVPNVDAFFNQAVYAGATVIMPVADMFWGDRYGVVEDPFGHRWSIATTQRRLTKEELVVAARAAEKECLKSQ